MLRFVHRKKNWKNRYSVSIGFIDRKNHIECGNKETYCKTCTCKEAVFFSIANGPERFNLMENNIVRYNRELNWTQLTTNCETSAKCVRIL